MKFRRCSPACSPGHTRFGQWRAIPRQYRCLARFVHVTCAANGVTGPVSLAILKRMELTVQNIYGLLLRSRLMPDETAKSIYQAWKQEAGAQAQDVGRFAKWLVSQRCLTDY